MFESRSEQHRKVPRSDEPVAELYNTPNFIRYQSYVSLAWLTGYRLKWAQANAELRSNGLLLRTSSIALHDLHMYSTLRSHANYRAGQGSEISMHNGR